MVLKVFKLPNDFSAIKIYSVKYCKRTAVESYVTVAQLHHKITTIT